MQEHAGQLVDCLRRTHTATVFTGLGAEVPAGPGGGDVEPRLRWRWARDRAVLERAAVDAWIILNAGISPYAARLARPAFVYVHGNDFVKPWFPHPGLDVRLVRKALPGHRRDRFMQTWRERQIRRGLNAARLVFANSRFTRDLCASRFTLPADRIEVVPPGIGAAFFQTHRPRAGTTLRIVTVARLATDAERKNIDGVLEAVARLVGEIDIQYTIVGDGNDRARLQERARALNVATRVVFTGRIDAGALRHVYASSDLFVMAVRPSPRDVEGFGMVYAEAAASGLPSLATAVGGIVDAVSDGVTGILIADATTDSIVDGLRRFYRDPGRFDPAALQAFASAVSATRCSERLAMLVADALTRG
ncbi:MAG: glycosyltransferase family 4 protein, partial [Janthinobacterium lividum]